jgi:hypothetical protein
MQARQDTQLVVYQRKGKAINSMTSLASSISLIHGRIRETCVPVEVTGLRKTVIGRSVIYAHLYRRRRNNKLKENIHSEAVTIRECIDTAE